MVPWNAFVASQPYFEDRLELSGSDFISSDYGACFMFVLCVEMFGLFEIFVLDYLFWLFVLDFGASEILEFPIIRISHIFIMIF